MAPRLYCVLPEPLGYSPRQLDAGSGTAASTVINTFDANKRVLDLRDMRETVVARKLPDGYVGKDAVDDL